MSSDLYRDEIVNDPHRNARICAEVKRRADAGDYPGIVFVRLLDHARVLQEELTKTLGYKVPIVEGNTPQKEKEETRLRLCAKDADLPVIVATSAWGTGVDIPCLRWVMRTSAGMAPIGLIQESGRALRPAGEEIEIIDVVDVGNCDPRWEEQADIRKGHLTRAGYKISDEKLTEKLLEGGSLSGPTRREENEYNPTWPELLMDILTPRGVVGWLLVILVLIITYCNK